MKKRNTIILILATILTIGAAIGVYYYKKTIASPQYPEIKFSSDIIKVSIDATEEDLLQGVTATDPEDGDVTDSLVVQGTSSIIKGNCIKVCYVAFDSQNHVTKAERTVEYTDYVPPRFTLSAPLIFKQSGSTDILKAIGARDVFDGDISRSIKYTIVNNGITLDEVGQYDVKLMVTNKIGDTTTLPVTVQVTDDEPNYAKIALTKYLIYLNKGDEFNPQDYLSSYEAEGTEEEETGEMVIDSNVNMEEAGVYAVDYTYIGRTRESHSRLIVVVE